MAAPSSPSVERWVAGTFLLPLLLALCACEPTTSAVASDPGLATPSRVAAYRQVRQRARAFFDALEVDPVELQRHGVKGTKKLGEIVAVYRALLAHTSEPQDRAAIQRRIAGLAAQTARPEYHAIAGLAEAEFAQNSMSYLRVAWLLEQLGVDTTAYRQHIRALQGRLDEHLRRRGPWQRAMFFDYYDHFGLEKPAGMPAATMRDGVIGQRVRLEAIDDSAAYALTHEVFVAFGYGERRTQSRFGADDLAYARSVLPALLRRYVAAKNADLAGELVSCLVYFGWHDDAACTAAVDWLLGAQNENGTWGDYEAERARFGKYLEHHVYLHTTAMVIEALMAVFDGHWPLAKDR